MSIMNRHEFWNSAPSSSTPQIPTLDNSVTSINCPINVDALKITDIAASGVRQLQPVDAQIAASQELESSPTPCPGIIVKIPPGKSVHSAYPFGLHDELGDPWDYTVVAGQLTLYARGCQKNLRPNKDRCTHCDGLSHNTTLQGVLDRIEFGVHENTRLVYHGVGGLVKIVRMKTRQINSLRLQNLNDSRKLMGKVAALDDHKEWIMAISSSKVQRVDRLVQNGLKR